jgi:hypothetical protein
MSNLVAQIVENYAIQRYIEPVTGGYYLPQPPGNQVVQTTAKKWSAGRGYGIVNEATSMAPVAITFFGHAATGTFILRPGEAIYPGEFDSFEYGLPFGWAGGGIVMLKVALQKDVRFSIPSARPEIPYWRVILKVEADASPLPVLKRNWPSKFPWEYATGSSAGSNQNGTPSIHVEPTRTLLFLPTAGKAGGIVPGTIYGARLFFRTDTTSDEMGQGNYSTDVAWAAPALGAIIPGLVTSIPAELDRLDLNLGGVTITSPDATLAVDDWCVAVRYGRI